MAAGHEIEPEATGPLTFAKYLDRWSRRRRDRGLSNAHNDDVRLRKHALTQLGSLALEDVRQRHIRDLFDSFAPRVAVFEIAPKTVHSIKGLLHKLFQDAIVDELISANPVVLRADELPPKTDKDPRWRRTAIFGRHEIGQLMSDSRIPLHRRVRYALIFLGCMRVGEASARRWEDYEQGARPLGRITIATQWNTKEQKVTALKTAKLGAVSREMPVHPLLASVLASWWLEGWAKTYGRPPRGDDLIIPNPFVAGKGRRVGGPDVHVRSDTVWSDLDADCKQLGFRHRRTHDARRSFISLAQEDGARRDILKWGTHGRPSKDIMDCYTEVA